MLFTIGTAHNTFKVEVMRKNHTKHPCELELDKAPANYGAFTVLYGLLNKALRKKLLPE
jgi:hypothetical protein